jgi:hypothetical protein
MDDLYRKDLPFPALSDVVRVDLLRRHGGIWVDATTYCLRPLSDWIDRATATGFFAFNQPAPDRMIASWFFAAESRSYIVDALSPRIRSYWNERSGEPDEYFWLHNIFRQAYDSDEEFRRLWDLSPKLSADLPRYFLLNEENLLGPVSYSHQLIVETAQTPLLKLTHKLDHDVVQANSLYRWLCDRMRRLTGSEAATVV